MRLSRVDLGGFGCLKDLDIEVAPGLHVFHGPNEAGKSTLQQALLALLYGFYDADRARKAENDARDRFAPWSGGPYAGRLEYELEDGRRYRVFRDFSNDELLTVVWDMVTGNDVTDVFGRGRHGNVPFMLRHLGMTRRVFEACAFVSQGELFAAAGEEGRASPQEIGETILKLADTAGRDISAKMALDRLGKVLTERVGGPTARARPLAVARASLDRFRAELAEIDLVRGELAQDAAELERLEQDALTLEKAVTRSQYLLLQAEVDDLNGRLRQLSDLEAEMQRLRSRQSANEPWSSFPVEERDNVQRVWTSIRDLRERLQAGAPEAETLRERAALLTTERDELARRERELAHLRAYPAGRSPEVARLLAAWRAASAVEDEAARRLTAAEALAAPLLGEYERLEAEVGSLTSADVDRMTERLRAGAGGPVVAALGVLAAVLSGIWRGIRRLARWLVRSVARRSNASGEPEPVSRTVNAALASADEAAALLQRHRRYLEITPDIRKYGDAAAAAERAKVETAAAAAHLRDALSGLVEDVLDLEAACAEFERRVADHRELQRLGERADSIDGELAAARAYLGNFEAEQERLKGLEANLSRQIELALGQTGPLDEMVERFEAACAGRQAYEGARRGLQEADARRGLMLSRRSPQDLSDAARRSEERLVRMAAGDPSLAGARSSESMAALKEEASRADRELQELRLRTGRLGTAIDTRLEGLRSRSEVEEEVARLELDVADLELFGQALRVAIEVIDASMKEAHRDFAPHVNQFLSQGLARVTDGRYRKAYLDPSTLFVTAEVPETGRIRGVETLSRGTRAAAYLLLRAGLAQHMSSLGEPVPLILDDPLVDLDDIRVRNFLELLIDLSERIQVLLFTKDEGTREWFERNCASSASHRLSLLGPAGAVAPAAASLAE